MQYHLLVLLLLQHYVIASCAGTPENTQLHGCSAGGRSREVNAGARDSGSIAITDNRYVPLRLDVTQPEQVDAAARACADVTLLINNAGIIKRSPMLAEDSEAAFRAEMEVHVFGVLRMVRAFAPVLANNGGNPLIAITTTRHDIRAGLSESV